MDEATRSLKNIQKAKLDQWGLTLWVIHKKKSREVEIHAGLLETAKPLEDRLRSTMLRQIHGAKRVIPYREEQMELDPEDGIVASYSAADTEFGPAIIAIATSDDGDGVDRIKSEEELRGAYAYAVVLRGPKDEDLVIAFRRLQASWSIRKKPFYWAMIKNAVMVDLKDQHIFRIDESFDFICVDEQLLILDRKGFERGVNLREGMTRKAEQVFTGLTETKLFADLSEIQALCTGQMSRLRKLATIEKKGYYKNAAFLDKLKTVAAAEGWPIEFEDGKLKLTPDNLDSMLICLADQRLKSPVTGLTYDADVASPMPTLPA